MGSLISATDPVSVLAIFKEMDADANLFAIVFGESIFNDAIGIVMYETVKNMGKDPNTPMSAEVGAAIGTFCIIFIGSIAIGAISALFVAFVQKRQAIFMIYEGKDESEVEPISKSPEGKKDNNLDIPQ